MCSGSLVASSAEDLLQPKGVLDELPNMRNGRIYTQTL